MLSTLRSYTLRKSPFVLLRIWESAVVLTVYVLREQPTNVQKDAIFRVQPHLLPSVVGLIIASEVIKDITHDAMVKTRHENGVDIEG